jgi:hypothetical protein
MKRVVSLLAALVAGSATTASAQVHTLLVINAGNQAIFALQAGSYQTQSWGNDLLAFNQVIEVSSGRDVAIDVDPSACVQDLRARFQDGDTQVLRSVDLCRADRVQFDR